VSTRANWHTADLADLDEEIDPFSVPVEEVGLRIDLLDEIGRLQARLATLLDQETNLLHCGIRCDIKDRENTCCHACPVSKAGLSDDPLSALCRLGREQERVVTGLAVQRIRGQERESTTG
jgi:hypothetical protein